MRLGIFANELRRAVADFWCWATEGKFDIAGSSWEARLMLNGTIMHMTSEKNLIQRHWVWTRPT